MAHKWREIRNKMHPKRQAKNKAEAKVNDVLVLYHANCMDGFTAAWVLWCKFGKDAEYIPASYGEEPPDVTGKEVWVVDFSYPLEILEQMKEKSKFIAVFDHHISAKKTLSSFDFCFFDMNRSGAGITWDRIFWDCSRPWLVNYVEDRDLWKFKLKDSQAINAYISTIPKTFKDWDNLSKLSTRSAAAYGQPVLDFKSACVAEHVHGARFVEFEGYTIPMVNCPGYIVSEAVGALAEGAGFALGWFQKANGDFKYSLRSRDDFDVSKLAQKYGGGGHKNAAGFTVKELLF